MESSCQNCEMRLGSNSVDSMFCSDECYYEYVGADTPEEQEVVSGGGTESSISEAIRKVRERRYSRA